MVDSVEEPAQQEQPRQQVLTRWIGVVSIFVAPTTIVTGLCFYFGYVSTRAYLAYFGVDSDAVGFSTGDYMLKSVSVLYPPLVTLLLIWAVALWGGEYARRTLKRGRHLRLVRAGAIGLGAVGAVAMVRGLVGVLEWPHLSWLGGEEWTPIALVAGVSAIGLGYWIITASRTGPARVIAPAERITVGLACAVMVLALFWIANIFANAYGDNRAKAYAASLWTKQTTIALYTNQRLDAPSNMVVETPLAQEPGVASYRYQCFRGLTVHGTRWVLLPARWTPQFGYAVILDVGASNRISVTRLQGIADTPAADWNGSRQCPEVAPTR